MRLSKNAKEKANAQGPFEVKTWRGNLQKPGKNLKRAGKGKLCRQGVIQKISVRLNLFLVELKLMGT